MKNLISATPREFKCNFDKIMNLCTDACMTINQEITIVIPEKKNSQTYVEVAKITPVGEGFKYSYNHELLKKFGISTDNRMNKIEIVVADAFEKSGIAEYARNDKELTDKLQKALTITANELIKRFNL